MNNSFISLDNDAVSLIEKRLSCRVTDFSALGKGASGCVYKVLTDREPYAVAVKVNCNPQLIFQEADSIEFISSRVDCKLPKVYFSDAVNNNGILAMEFIKGVTPSVKTLLFKSDKKKLANEIVDNLIKIHSVQNQKYGPVNNPVYDSWLEYYSEYAGEIIEFTNSSDAPKIVKKAVNLAWDRLYDLIGADVGEPALTHGDYWTPNLIVDNRKMTLKGVLDPYNVIWAEPEYELFTLTVDYGKRLHLYELYKSKIKVSDNCDVKVELYSLINELSWYKALGKVNFGYLVYRSRRLLKMIS